MSTVPKKSIIIEIAEQTSLHPQKVREIVQSVLDSISDSLCKGDRIEFRGFGVFDVVQRKPKIGRNPMAPSKPILIPARSVATFTPAKEMRRRIEGK